MIEQILGDSCSKYYNVQKKQLRIPDGTFCQFSVDEVFLTHILDEILIYGTLVIEDNLSFHLKFNKLKIGQFGKLQIGYSRPIINNVMIFEEQGNEIYEQGGKGTFEIYSTPYQPYEVDLIKNYTSIRLKKVPTTFYQHEKVLFAGCCSALPQNEKYQITKIFESDITLLINDDINLKQFKTYQNNRKFDTPLYIFPQVRIQAGVSFINTQLKGKVIRMEGVAFVNQKFISLEEGKIQKCFFTQNKVEPQKLKTNFDFGSQLNSNIFYNFNNNLISHVTVFLDNYLVKVSGMDIFSNYLSESKIIDSYVRLFPQNQEFNGLLLLKLQIQYSHIFVNRSSLLEETTLLIKNVTIHSSIVDISIESLVSLEISNSQFLETNFFIIKQEFLKTLTLTNSTFIGNKEKQFQLQKGEYFNPLQIKIINCLFKGIKNPFVEISSDANENDYFGEGESEITYVIEIDHNTQFLYDGAPDVARGLFNLHQMKIIFIDDENNQNLIYYQNTLHMYHNSLPINYYIPSSKILQYYEKKLVFMKILSAKFEASHLQFQQFNLKMNNFDKCSNHINYLFETYEKRYQLEGNFVFEGKIYADQRISVLIFQITQIKSKGTIFPYNIEFESTTRAIKSFTLLDLSGNNSSNQKNNQIEYILENGIIKIILFNIFQDLTFYTLTVEYCEEGQVLHENQCVNNCEDSYYYVGFICLPTCNSKGYQLSEFNTCFHRNLFGCEVVMKDDPTKCEKCMTNFFRQDDVCAIKCFDGYFQVNDECHKCPENCTKCLNQHFCIDCQEQNQNSDCQNCPSDQYLEEGKCQACPSYCKKCTGINHYQCFECQQGFEMFNGMCQQIIEQNEICEFNQFYKQQIGCQNCPQQCAACDDSIEHDECLQCLSNYQQFWVGNGKVMCFQCPNNYIYYQGKCNSCNQLCQNGCYGLSSLQCY